jgi:hypothetical protein
MPATSVKVIASVLLLVAAEVAHSELIVVDFEGVVSFRQLEEDYPILRTITVGSRVSGRFTYESDPDHYGGDTIEGPSLGGFLKDPARNIGLRDLKFGRDPSLGPRLVQDPGEQAFLSVFDDLDDSLDGDEFLVGGQTRHADFAYWVFLSDPSDSALSSDDIPLNLEDFPSATLTILPSAQNTPLIDVTITALDVAAEASCIAGLTGTAIDPDGPHRGIGAVRPSGRGRFRQLPGEGPRADFSATNVALGCGTRLDVCLERTGVNRSRVLLQQLLVCDASGLAGGRAGIDERRGPAELDPVPDAPVTPLAAIDEAADDICEAVEGRRIRLRRSESGGRACDEPVVVEGAIED